jgi:hypothetical protein
MGIPEPLKTLPVGCVTQWGLINEHRDIATTPSGSLHRTPERFKKPSEKPYKTLDRGR